MAKTVRPSRVPTARKTVFRALLAKLHLGGPRAARGLPQAALQDDPLELAKRMRQFGEW